ncbi:hypothetical protein [Streptomyces collinus]|uniref:hypothetical protein n=1 Tax=Streptomyces collinus TaxID=42684 RepID=UPI0036759DD6
MDASEQVAVAIEESAVGTGGADEPGHGGVVTAAQGRIQGLEDAFAAAAGVGAFPLIIGLVMRWAIRDAGRAVTYGLSAAAEDDLAGAADELDGLLDLGAILVGEFTEVGVDTADEATDAGDLLVGRHGLALEPSHRR